MSTSDGNGHKPGIHPISDEALNAFAERLQGILLVALREALQIRKDDLIGKEKTVADLVANIDDAVFRTNLSEYLLWLKIDVLLAGLQSPPLDLITEAEYQEMHTYLERLQERAQRFPDTPSA